MAKFSDFLWTILKSLNPDSLKDLSERITKDSLKYIFSLIAISLLLMVIVAIPKLIFLPAYINNQFGKFNNLSINMTTDMKEPVTIVQSNPQLIIDTTGNITKLGKANLLITKHMVMYRSLFKVKAFNISGFENILENKKGAADLIIFLAVLVFPMLLVMLYIVYSLKYLIIIIITVLLSFVVLKLIKHKIKFVHLFNLIIYASTSMILLELLTLPYLYNYLLPIPLFFGVTLPLIPLALFIVYFMIGIILTDRKEERYE
jgi:hypothetical protein